ncbi:MAG TPA: FtsX-like permease family protein [Thermoplasmata archaeon]
MARPILRLATRFTRRTRATAWAIGFACMVLVGALSLVDGLASGIGSVADRIGSGPAVYIRGSELLASAIDADEVATIPGDFLALRVHPAELEINGTTLSMTVVALESYRNGTATTAYPTGANDVSLDAGLRTRITELSSAPPGPTGSLTVFGRRLADLPIVAPPPSVPVIFADDWAYVRPALLAATDPVRGGPIQAILSEVPLDPSSIASHGLTRLETFGAIGFVRGSISEVQRSLAVLALVIAVVIGLLVYAAMSLEVHQRAAEIATLRSLGASPATVASVYEAQAILLAVAGAVLGSALGVVAAHAVVSFAPLLGLPNLVLLDAPINAVLLAFGISIPAAAVAGLVPSRRAAVQVAHRKGAGPS